MFGVVFRGEDVEDTDVQNGSNLLYHTHHKQ
jgi:hypothetical protein